MQNRRFTTTWHKKRQRIKAIKYPLPEMLAITAGKNPIWGQ